MAEQRTLDAQRAALDAGNIDANKLEAMAKEMPDECFLKGSGVLKLIGAIRQLEQAARRAPPALDAEGLPELPPGDDAGRFAPTEIVYLPGQVRQAMRNAVAADRRARNAEIADLRAQLAHQTEAARRWESKLDSVWEGIRTAVSKYSGKPCEGEPFDALDELLARKSAPEGAPVGMVLVPMVSTTEMDSAGHDALLGRGANAEVSDAEACWNAMIGAAPTSASAHPADRAPTAQQIEGAVHNLLWLYRRLPRCYGRLPFVEASVRELTKIPSVTLDECFAERGASSAQISAQPPEGAEHASHNKEKNDE